MRTTSCRALTLDQSPDKIATRLGYFSAACSMIGADQWDLKTVMQGYQIPSVQSSLISELRYSPTYPQGWEKWKLLNLAVQDMRDKGAIELAPSSPSFYSCLFFVPKTGGGSGRPIIDLSALNTLINCPSFTLETPRSIRSALGQGQWLTSLDLQDAYFQIGINPADRRFLRFSHNGTGQFRTLPFCPSTSWSVFFYSDRY